MANKSKERKLLKDIYSLHEELMSVTEKFRQVIVELAEIIAEKEVGK